VFNWLKKIFSRKTESVASMPIKEEPKRLEKPCRTCGKPIFYDPSWEHIPNYCKECKRKYQDEHSIPKIMKRKCLDYGGKGYAYEAAHAYFDYLFNQKGIRRIYAYTEDYNVPSQRLCERLGMRREGLFLDFVSFINNPDGTPHYENTVQYAILKREWK